MRNKAHMAESDHRAPPITPFPGSTCPLCLQLCPRESLHRHIAAEHPRLRHSTIRVIQAYHPGWEEEYGACEACWRSYRQASRMFNLMRSARRQVAAASRELALLAVQSRARS